jgi:WD40 repeat protein
MLLAGAIVSTWFAVLATKSGRRAAVRAEQARCANYLAAINAADLGLLAGDHLKAREALATAPEEYRGWEWQLLAARAAHEVRVVDLRPWHRPAMGPEIRLERGAAPVGMTADGRFVALCANGSTLTLVDLETGSPLWTVSGTEPWTQWAISEDATTVVALAHQHRDVSAWNGRDGRPRWSWHIPDAPRAPADSTPAPLYGDWPGAVGVLLSADGHHVSVLVEGRRVVLIDADTGLPVVENDIRTFEETHGGALRDLNFPYSRVAVSSARIIADDPLAAFWAEIGFLRSSAHQWEPTYLAPASVSPAAVIREPVARRDPWFAWVEGNQGIRLLSAGDEASPRLLEGHWDRVMRMAFSRDATTLFSVDAIQNICSWLSLPPSMRSGEPASRSGDRKGRTDVPLAIMPNSGGSRLCVATSRSAAVLSLEVRNPIRLEGHQRYVYFAAFSPDGRTVATSAWGGRVRLWDCATGRFIGALPAVDRRVVSIAFSRDGRRLLAFNRGAGGPPVMVSFDATTRAPVDRIEGTECIKRFLTDAAPGATITGGSDAAQCSQTDARGRVVVEGRMAANRLAVDESWSVAGDAVVLSDDLKTRLFEITLPVDAANTNRSQLTCSISRDGSLIAVVRESGSPIYLYDGRSGALMGDMAGHPARIFSMDFSPDNSRLVTGGTDSVAIVWDVARREAVLELRGHDRYVHDVRFSPDGRRLITASGDRTAQLWDARTAQAN